MYTIGLDGRFKGANESYAFFEMGSNFGVVRLTDGLSTVSTTTCVGSGSLTGAALLEFPLVAGADDDLAGVLEVRTGNLENKMESGEAAVVVESVSFTFEAGVAILGEIGFCVKIERMFEGRLGRLDTIEPMLALFIAGAFMVLADVVAVVIVVEVVVEVV